MPPLPLVSVGLPVYNGMPHLRVAVDALLKQNYPNLEIVISDNASSDGTLEYCRALAEIHPHVRYVRNPQNVGPAENFRLALVRSNGEYFMWAAHDDRWCDRYVSGLVESLSATSEAVLATPTVLHICDDGTLSNEPPDRPATAKTDLANLRLMFDDHSATWIYGLWRTVWLREHFAEFLRYPIWGNDVLWLTDVCLRYPITGNQEAIIYKRRRASVYAPRNALQAVTFWAYMFWHITEIVNRRATGRRRWQLRLMSWRYVYQLCIRRPHLLRTGWRVVRMLSVAAIILVAHGLARAGRWLARTLPPALDYAVERKM
jgi:glycosyltransferase involved in cell wall biosynthesis